MGAVPAPPTPLAGSVATPTGPGYDVVLLGHVGCAGHRVAHRGGERDPGRPAARGGPPGPSGRGEPVEVLCPGVNWAGRALYGVPLLGFALIAMSNGSISTGDPWVLTGLVLWAAAAAWPRGCCGRPNGGSRPIWPRRPSVRCPRPRCPAAGGGRARRRPAARTVCASAVAVAAVVLVAMVVMVAQP